MKIEINGKTYTERPQPEKNKGRMSRLEYLAMAMANMERYTYSGSNYFRPFPELKNSLVDEFRLIQEKKSSLTSAERKMVENQFHRVYQEVQNDNAK
jgi:hypothetical protein